MNKATQAFIFVTAVSVSANCVFAISPFKKAFDEKYVKSSDNEAFKAAYKKESCRVCHVKGKKYDWVNAYGLALAKKIPGNVKERLDQAKAVDKDALKAENEKLIEELKKAFKATESMKAPSGELFGKMLKEHRLPTADGAKSIYAKDDKSEKEADKQPESPENDAKD